MDGGTQSSYRGRAGAIDDHNSHGAHSSPTRTCQSRAIHASSRMADSTALDADQRGPGNVVRAPEVPLRFEEVHVVCLSQSCDPRGRRP